LVTGAGTEVLRGHEEQRGGSGGAGVLLSPTDRGDGLLRSSVVVTTVRANRTVVGGNDVRGVDLLGDRNHRLTATLRRTGFFEDVDLAGAGGGGRRRRGAGALRADRRTDLRVLIGVRCLDGDIQDLGISFRFAGHCHLG